MLVTTYELPFSGKNNIESLVADSKNDRLLMVAKDKDPFTETTKGIYAFELKTKKFNKTPVYSIDIEHDIFKTLKNKKTKQNIRPSELGIHPHSGYIYVLEGVNPKLLILDAKGNPKNIHVMNKEEFFQPEGLTFSPNGTMYISNEGSNSNPNILKIDFD